MGTREDAGSTEVSPPPPSTGWGFLLAPLIFGNSFLSTSLLYHGSHPLALVFHFPFNLRGKELCHLFWILCSHCFSPQHTLPHGIDNGMPAGRHTELVLLCWGMLFPRQAAAWSPPPGGTLEAKELASSIPEGPAGFGPCLLRISRTSMAPSPKLCSEVLMGKFQGQPQACCG